MLILIFKCATDRTTKTKWWSLTSLVLWTFDFWSQGVNTGLWRSQFKITNTPHLNPPPSYWAWFRSRLTLFRSSKVSGKTMLYPRKSNLFHSCAGLSCIFHFELSLFVSLPKCWPAVITSWSTDPSSSGSGLWMKRNLDKLVANVWVCVVSVQTWGGSRWKPCEPTEPSCELPGCGSWHLAPL